MIRRFAWWGTSSVMSAGARPFAASATATDCGISTDADLNTSRPSITARCFPWRISDSLMYGSCARTGARPVHRSEEHTSELQSQSNLVCRLLLEKKKKQKQKHQPNLEQPLCHINL